MMHVRISGTFDLSHSHVARWDLLVICQGKSQRWNLYELLYGYGCVVVTEGQAQALTRP